MRSIIYAILLLISLVTQTAHAQDFPFGKITNSESKLQKFSIDSFSNAVILNEYGNSFLYFDDQTGRTSVKTFYHKKIKIFNSEAYDQANVVVPLYGDNSDITDIKAIVYGPANTGFKESVLDSKNIYREKVNTQVTLVKFTLPNLQPGCIVEYQYEYQSPNIFNFHTWFFQEDIPKMHSHFKAIIPGNFTYRVSLRSFYPIKPFKPNLLKENFNYAGWRVDCSELDYAMDSIPAFVSEDFMTSPYNFKSAIYFELSDIMNRNGSVTKYTKTWADEERFLYDNSNFGKQIRNKNSFKSAVSDIASKEQDELKKSKLIYEYIRKTLKWNEKNDLFTSTSIDNILKNRVGNSADLNIALIAALNQAGIKVEAAILSTRNNGVVNNLFPVLSDFNYVVGLATIKGKKYWLDATDRTLDFGILPFRCLNDSARIIPNKGSSYWVKIKPEQSMSERYILDAKIRADGKLEGILSITNDSYQAARKREQIQSFPSQDEYVDKRTSYFTGIKIGDYSISGVDSTSEPIVETYHIVMNFFDSLNIGKAFLNPFLFNQTQVNPFKLNERLYPVDFGLPSETDCIIKIQLPENFEIQSKPKNTHFMLPGSTAEFTFRIEMQDHILHCEYNERINQAQFFSEDYLNLKALYSQIIQTEKKDIIFSVKK